MKMSISLPDEDIKFLDTYMKDQGVASRSAAVHEAVGLLRTAQLAGAYEDAWASWDSSGDSEAWDATSADGLDN